MSICNIHFHEKIRKIQDLSLIWSYAYREHLFFCHFQLQETLVKYEQTEENFQKERRGTMDRQQHNSHQIRQVESELNTANNKIRELRDEVQKKQSHIMRLETDKVGHSVSENSKRISQKYSDRQS